MNDICKSVGMSRAAFYRLFEDKYAIPRWCHYLAFRMGICEIGRTLDVRQGNIVSLNGKRLPLDRFAQPRDGFIRANLMIAGGVRSSI